MNTSLRELSHTRCTVTPSTFSGHLTSSMANSSLYFTLSNKTTAASSVVHLSHAPSGTLNRKLKLKEITSAEKVIRLNEYPLSGFRDAGNCTLLKSCCCETLKCGEKLLGNWQKQLHDKFWSLASFNVRKRWLLNNILRLKNKCLPPRTKRNCDRKWFLKDPTGKVIRVCRLFFLRTLSYQWDSVLYFILKDTQQTSRNVCSDHHDSKHISDRTKDNLRWHIFTHVKSFLKKHHPPLKNSKGSHKHDYSLVKKSFHIFKATHPHQTVSYGFFRQIFYSVFAMFTIDATFMSMMPNVNLLSQAYQTCDLPGVKHEDPSFKIKKSLKANKAKSTFKLKAQNNVVTTVERLKDEEKEGAKVIMQLDVDNAAVVITQNCSNSDTEIEEEETKELENNTIKVAMYKEKNLPCVRHTRKKVNLNIEHTKEEHPILSPCTCKRLCFTKLSETRRKEIYSDFWKIESYSEKKQWIVKHTQISDLKRRDRRRKRDMRSYLLTDEKDHPVLVCAEYFQRTLGLFDSTWIKTLCDNTPIGIWLPHSEQNSQRKQVKKINAKVRRSLEQFIKNHKASADNSNENIGSQQSDMELAVLSVKKLHCGFLAAHSDVSVSYELFKTVYDEVHKGLLHGMGSAGSEDGSGSSGSRSHFLRSRRLRVSCKSVIGNSDGLTSEVPERRRSTRTTRMQGSMAEDSLLELGNEFNMVTNDVSTSKNLHAKRKTDTDCFAVKMKPCKNYYTKHKSRSSKPFTTSEPAVSQHEKVSFQDNYRKIKLQSSKSDLSLATSKLYPSNRGTSTTGKKKSIKQRRHDISEYGKKKKHERSHYKSNAEAAHQSKRHCQLFSLKNKRKHPILPPCNCNRRKCIDNIPEERRRQIHEQFWNLSSYRDRKQWLIKYVEKRERKVKVLSLFPQRKNESKKYFLPDSQDGIIEVCRLFFIHTLGFRWDSVIEAIVKTKTPSHFVTEKNNQLRKTPRLLPEYIVDSVKEYLKSIQDSQINSETVIDNPGEDSNKDKCKSKAGLKVKDLFKSWKDNHKCLKFNLGYHSFRRIFQGVVDPVVDTNGRVTSKDTYSHTSDVDSGVNDRITTLLPVTETSNSRDIKTTSSSEVKSSISLHGKSSSESTDKMSPSSDQPEHQVTTGDHSIFQDNIDSCQAHVALQCTEQNPSITEDTADRILDIESGYFKKVDSSGGHDIHHLDTSLDCKYKKRRSLSVRNDRSNYPVLPPCKCSKRKCAEKFSEVQRQKINDVFWNLDNYNERKQWILEHIKRADIKRRVVISEGVPRKLESRWYYMPDDKGNKIDVCKAFFLRTLGYRWDSVIDTIGKTTPKGEKCVVPDKRGRKPPPHKISNEAVTSMTLYIENVCQMYQPLYQQKSQNTKKANKTSMGTLIPYGLTMKQLFEDYRSKHPNHKFGYESFRKIFRRVHGAFLASLPQDLESGEEPEAAYSEMAVSVDKDYSESAIVESSGEFQPKESHFIPTTGSYSDISQYTSPPPAPPSSHHQASHQDQAGNSAPERRSCLYQYSDQSCESQQLQPLPAMQAPDTVGSLPQDRYSSLDHDPFMKYSHNLYYPPGHFSQVADHLGYSSSFNPQADIDPNICGAGQSQFPPYFMPNPEPLRCQVYQMASQYKSILHHFAESSRYFSYGNFPPQDASFQEGHEKQYPYMKHQDVHRENVNSYNLPKTSNNYISESPTTAQYHLNQTPHNNMQQVSTTMILSPYSDANDNSFVPEENLCVMNDQDVSILCGNDFPSGAKAKKSASKARVETKKAKNDKPKVKKEKKMKPKSVRNYGDHYPILSPCHCKKKKCTDKFSEMDRQRIHNTFWDLKDYNERKQWMLLHIKREDCKRRRIDQFESFRKQESRWYFFPDKAGHQHEVCKDFFLRTLGYKWDSVIDTIRRTTPKGETSTRPDQRGRKAPSHKLSNDVLRSVVQYIESMQQVSQPFNANCTARGGQLENLISDQSSQDTGSSSGGGQIAIPYGLTMKDLYDDYKAKHAGHKIGYESFRRIFRALSRSEKIMDNRSGDDEILNPDGQDLIDF